MAHTHGDPPNAIVDWPAVGLSFANPDDSGLGGGGQGKLTNLGKSKLKVRSKNLESVLKSVLT